MRLNDARADDDGRGCARDRARGTRGLRRGWERGCGRRPAAGQPCDLLTTEEAEDLLGVPTSGPSEDTDRSGGTYCLWASEDSNVSGDASDVDDDGEDPYFIGVEDESGVQAIQEFESGKTVLNEDEEEADIDPVDGLGNDAYFSDPHGLSVRHGDRVFSTFAGGSDAHPLSGGESKGIERRAADIIIERLGEPKNESVAEKAEECARTRRCSGTRYNACDLLKESELRRLTGFNVKEVDGRFPPGGSETAASCQYILNSPDDENAPRTIGTVDLDFEPDAETAREDYGELVNESPEVAMNKVPDLGDDAFYDEDSHEVYVLKSDTLLSIEYGLAVDLPVDDQQAERKRVVVELAKVVAARI